jgi:hypothetical protein
VDDFSEGRVHVTAKPTTVIPYSIRGKTGDCKTGKIPTKKMNARQAARSRMTTAQERRLVRTIAS